MRARALTSVIGATQSFNFAMAGGGTIVGAIGNMVGGTIYENNYSLPFYLMAGSIALTAIIGIALVREPEKREE
jgi:hypothetical protein